MKSETYMYGVPGVKWGIWNAKSKTFVFGICEDTPMLAKARLFQKIGTNAYKWRFEERRLPKKKKREGGKDGRHDKQESCD